MSKLNVLIDGPSRSGKLLLGKLIMTSPSMAFQHYSGDLERILESIFFAEHENIEESLYEILRLNLVHTFNDLKELRQLSINPNDSSFYKKTLFFKNHKSSISDGGICDSLKENTHGFVIHTHESFKFLQYAREIHALNTIFSDHFKNIAYIIRNPSAQALSWHSRKYLQDWKQLNQRMSPFTLYKLDYYLPCLSNLGIKKAPWFINKSIEYFLQKDELSESDFKSISDVEIIVLSVCYITTEYLCGFSDASDCLCIQHPRNQYYLFHEDLHDYPLEEAESLINFFGLLFDVDQLKASAENETSREDFGRQSIEKKYANLQLMICNENVACILRQTHKKYVDILNR